MRARTVPASRGGAFARADEALRLAPKLFSAVFRRDHAQSKGSDGGSLADAWRRCAHMGRWCVPNAAAVRLKKPAAGFPARALKIFAMMRRCQ